MSSKKNSATSTCPECGVEVAKNLPRHLRKAHGIGTEVDRPVRGRQGGSQVGPWLRLVIPVAALVLLGVLIFFLLDPGGSEGGIDAPNFGDLTDRVTSVIDNEVGYRAPPFRLADMNGEIINLNDLEGKPVVLGFYATWCMTCWTETQNLNEIAAQTEAEFIWIDLDQTEDDTDLQRFASSIGGPNWKYVMDRGGAVTLSYEAGLDSTFIINRHGTIVYKDRGATDTSMVLATIEAL